MNSKQLDEFARDVTDVFRQEAKPALVARRKGTQIVIMVHDEILARFTKQAQGALRMSYRNHTGRWEPMPFQATNPLDAASLTMEVLAPHIDALTVTF